MYIYSQIELNTLHFGNTNYKTGNKNLQYKTQYKKNNIQNLTDLLKIQETNMQNRKFIYIIQYITCTHGETVKCEVSTRRHLPRCSETATVTANSRYLCLLDITFHQFSIHMGNMLFLLCNILAYMNLRMFFMFFNANLPFFIYCKSLIYYFLLCSVLQIYMYSCFVICIFTCNLVLFL